MDGRRKLIAVLATTCCGCWASPALAADQVVANNLDTGGGSLRQAIIDVGDGETVTIPGSVGPIALTSGEISFNKSITITGAGAATTSISGNDASRIFHVMAPATSLTLGGMTLRDGLATGAVGGAIFAESGALTLSNLALVDNHVQVGPGGDALGGGAVYAGLGGITLNSSTVTGNSAAISTTAATDCCHGGGGVFSNGPIAVNGGAVSDNSVVVTGPVTSSGTECCDGGGGLYNNSNAPTTITGATLAGNTATINGESCCHGGGAIFSAADQAVSITNSVLSGNQATITGQAAPVADSAAARAAARSSPSTASF